MIWESVYGKWAAKVQAQYAVNRRPLGPGMGDCPEIPDDIMFYWNAYQDLSTERSGGETIPFFKIIEYAKLYGVQPETFKLVMWKVDEIYLPHLRDKAKAIAKAESAARENAAPARQNRAWR